MKKLSLRDLFWLVFVAAMGCAWWVSHQRLSGELQDTKRNLDAARAHIASWERITKAFAHDMRRRGWNVQFEADANRSSWSISIPEEEEPDTAPTSP